MDYIVRSTYCHICHLSDDRAGSGLHCVVNVLSTAVNEVMIGLVVDYNRAVKVLSQLSLK